MKKKLVILTGAGISQESGLKTFRDSDGLWENYDVEDVATATAWKKNPGLVLEFYNMRRHDALKAEPNLAHKILVELEEHFDVTIITTNVDDLHERAGSSKIIHLHGEITKMRSVKNTKNLFPYEDDIKLGDLAEDGGQLRPHIVWFEEDVPLIHTAMLEVYDSDIFVVVGSSMQVYPASNLINSVNSDVAPFIVDPIKPKDVTRHNVTFIEKKATEGMSELKEILINQYK